MDIRSTLLTSTTPVPSSANDVATVLHDPVVTVPSGADGCLKAWDTRMLAYPTLLYAEHTSVNSCVFPYQARRVVATVNRCDGTMLVESETATVG